MSVRALAVAGGLVLAGGAGTGVGVLGARPGDPPAKRETAKPPAPDIDRLLADLDAEIAREMDVRNEAQNIAGRIAICRDQMKFLDQERVMLEQKRSALQAGRPSPRLAAEAAADADPDPKQVAAAVDAQPECRELLRTVTRHTLELEEGPATDDPAREARLQEAQAALRAARAKVKPAVVQALRDRQAAEAVATADGDTRRHLLRVLAKQIDAVKVQRQAAELQKLELTKELKKVTQEDVTDQAERLRRLKDRRAAVETELLLQAVRAKAAAKP